MHATLGAPSPRRASLHAPRLVRWAARRHRLGRRRSQARHPRAPVAQACQRRLILLGEPIRIEGLEPSVLRKVHGRAGRRSGAWHPPHMLTDPERANRHSDRFARRPELPTVDADRAAVEPQARTARAARGGLFSASLDKSTVTVVRKTCGDSGLSGGREGAETARGSGVLTLRDPVAVCGLRGDDNVWADCACLGDGETTMASRAAQLRVCLGVVNMDERAINSPEKAPRRAASTSGR
eukprot:scaffold27966_cov64-Phaeocystis_antarctica.AAC.12